MKKCSKCEEIKNYNDFYLCRFFRDGYSYWCKDCARLYDKQRNK